MIISTALANEPAASHIVHKFYEDPLFWVGVSVLVFLTLTLKAMLGAGKNMLSLRIVSIKDKIDETKDLKEEAAKILAEYKKKNKNVESEIKELVHLAIRDAERMRIEAKKDLDEIFSHKEKITAERLKLLTDLAMMEVKQHAINLSIDATTALIKENLTEKLANKLIDDAIDELPENFPNLDVA